MAGLCPPDGPEQDLERSPRVVKGEHWKRPSGGPKKSYRKLVQGDTIKFIKPPECTGKIGFGDIPCQHGSQLITKPRTN